MKKLTIIITLLVMAFTARAQGTFNLLNDKEIFTELMRSTIMIIFIYVVLTFVLTLIRLFLNDRLKRALLEKGADAEVIDKLLPKKQELTGAVKGVAIFTAIGTGLLIISCCQLTNLYAVVVLAFSIALGLLGYALWVRRFHGQ